jgi:hypothetical protein
MGLSVSASLNILGNPMIYGSNTDPQTAIDDPVVDNPLSHRVAIDDDASNVEISISPVSTASPIDVAATLAFNAANITAVETGTDYEIDVDGDGFLVTNASGSIEPGFTTGLRFVFEDASIEDHVLYVMGMRMDFSKTQTSCTNSIVLDYNVPSQEVNNPLTNYGRADYGTIKYQYRLPDGDWVDVGTTGIPTEALTLTLPDAYPDVDFRAIWTILDENNNIIYQEVLEEDDFAMTECTPTASFTLSDLYCGCTTIDVTDGTSYQNRQNWYVAVFTRNILDATPYYKGPELGDLLNPQRDSKWAVPIPFNGAYTFRVVGVKKYEDYTTYGSGDWTYNPSDGKLYVSLQPGNLGNALSDLVNWRKWNPVTDMETVFTKTVNTAAGTFIYANMAKSITCNTEDTVQVKNKKSCESACSTIVFDDTTGEFDFSANPHGYGLPHYRRDAYANAYFLINNKSDGTVASFLPATYNYLSAMSVMFDIKKDGWYRLYMYQVQVYDPTKRYYLKDLVFDEDSNLFYKSLVNNNIYALSNIEAWSVVSTWEDFRDNKPFKDYQWDHVVKCNAEKTLNDVGLGVDSDKCAKSCQDELLAKYYLLRIYLAGACSAEAVYDYVTAQCLLEKIPKNCAPYMGGSRTGGCLC